MKGTYFSKKEAVASKEKLPRTREEAIAKDTKYYYPVSEPCPKNHDSPRNALDDNRCIMCLIEKNQKQRSKPDSWIEGADGTERRARYRARENGALPDDYDRDECRRVYRLARFFTKETEDVIFEVDHEIPLTRGGLHRSDNLLIVTHETNADKGNLTPGEYLCKLGIQTILEAISYGKSRGELL